MRRILSILSFFVNLIMSNYPDFIIIGAGKCGTTSLYTYLKQHPQVYLCPHKETYFFVPEPIRSKFKPWGAMTNFDDYTDLFKDASQNNIIGEISTTYYRHAESAQEIYHKLPQVKIIAILRDPANRAFSDYQMHFRKGNEKEDFTSLISPDNRFIKPGFYYAELVPYFKVFPQEQIKILLFDDLVKNSANFIADLFEFIEVDSQFTPNTSTQSRKGGLPKNQTVNILLTKPNPLRKLTASVLSLFIPFSLRQELRASLVKKNIQQAKLAPEVRQQLIEVYRYDISKLQELIDRDLSLWLQ